MGKSGGNPEHALVFFIELHPFPLSEGRRVFPQINGDIEDLAGHHPDQFTLGTLYLVMQPPEDALSGPAVIILDKGEIGDFSFEFIIPPGFHEKTAMIPEAFRFKQNHAG